METLKLSFKSKVILVFTSAKVPLIQQELSVIRNEKKHVFSDNSMPLKIAGITNDSQLTLKNLGKQINWRLVFYIEYAGPLIIMPLLFLLGKKEQYNEIQYIALVLSIIHYIKREYETAYVHVFSRTSMPFKRVFINSIHYWIFFALANGIELYFFPSGHTYPQPILIMLILAWSLF